uniref:Transposase n=1 Tax=Candidatus Kentrum sp. TC TaxID=2126339 RepID=A0A451A5V5_9GAMM|nr:MAG: hypothetical protein BECKTC1821F_GA0114240_105724 [Candidatus Kentron sp. TC]
MRDTIRYILLYFFPRTRCSFHHNEMILASYLRMGLRGPFRVLAFV